MCFRYALSLSVNDQLFYAREHAITWGEFWSIGGPALHEYCRVFFEGDPYNPMESDLIADISDYIFILDDEEFPGVQCAEETTTLFGDKFPAEYCTGSITTEYGEKINIYSDENHDELLKASKLLGNNVEMLVAPFPMNLYDYS